MAPAPHGASVHADHGRPRLRPVRRAGWRLGLDRVAERRRPRPRARVRLAPQLHHRAEAGRRDRTPPRRSSSERDAVDRVPHDRRRLPGDPGHEAADRRLLRSKTRPPGSCAWIVEKFAAWTDCDGDVERDVHQGPVAHQHHRVLGDRNGHVVGAAVLRDAPGRTRARSRRRTWACPPASRTTPARSPARRGRGPSTATTSPTGPSSRHGGHFAAMQVPDLFVADVREFFRTVR